MNTIEEELNKSGIQVICPISTFNVNEIATYVANLLCSKFAAFNLDYNVTFQKIANLKMYIANMPSGMSDACYFYKNNSIYFRKGIRFDDIKSLAFHECIHHFQEIKDSKGELRRLGLCSYQHSRAYGTALNEAAVQLMSAYATGEPRDIVKYYGVTFLTDSPSYYPLLCNLMKQLGYLIGYPVLFESTFYANDKFFDKFKFLFTEKTAYKVQQNFDKLVDIEEKIIKMNITIQTKDLSYIKFKSMTDKIKKYKDEIKNIFINTQNLIISTYFDSQMKEIRTAPEIETYRKKLYSISGLIGTCDNYSFFNNYYIDKMSELDRKYEQLSGNTEIAVVKRSKLSLILTSLRNFFSRNAYEYKNNDNN